jgi:hypothetical protein
MKAEDPSEGGGTTCYFCREEAPGDIYDFYAGFCVDYQRTRAFLSNTVHIKATYRDLKRYGVLICEACAARTRQKRHLPGFIGWGLAALGCGIGAAVVAVLKPAGDQNIYLLGVLGLFGGLSALLAVLEGMALARLGSSPAVILKVMEEVKTDRAFREKGDTFFDPAEYQVMFKDAGPPEPLAPEDIYSPSRTGGERPRKPKARKTQDAKPCPHCGGTIPTYAQACPHCKRILV